MENLLIMASSFLPLSKPLQIVSVRHKLIQIIRTFLALSFFFLRLLFSLLPPPTPHKRVVADEHRISGSGDSGVARALSQMLSIVHEIPVGSRKYETLRALAERVMDENVREESAEVNREVLSSAFESAVARLQGIMWWRAEEPRGAAWVIRPVMWVARAEFGLGSGSPEKIAAELLWMARKMVECGAGERAICMWGSASGLASMAVAAEPALQGSLVKVSAFLFKQAKEKDSGMGDEGVKLKMLMSWLPMLCHASNGTDTLVLSSAERAEMECVLEEMIEKLSNCDQEKVLALWLYHFTSCPNSDWPNLQSCYARWYATSRKLFLLNHK
ncbi:hypothetical protein AAC387_Pa11g1303 [Persea americana]